MESCLGKTVLSGGMGFVLGGAFGLFMSSVCLPALNRHVEFLFPILVAIMKISLITTSCLKVDEL